MPSAGGSYVLGVDLGTTYTAAAVHDGEGASMVSLAHDRVAVPSVVALGESGLVFGDAALAAGATEPERVAREFKRRFGDTTPILLGGTPFAPDLLMARLLEWVHRAVSDQRGSPPSMTVVSHPANWGAYKLDLLRQAADVAAVGPVRFLPEPVAAAVHYDQRQRIAEGSSVAVYDLGGGTFDATVVQRGPRGFELLGEAAGIEHLGGVDLDEVLFQMVRDHDRAAFKALDPEDPQTILGALRLREECTRAKVALSFDTRATIPVLLPGLVTEVLVQRSEFEQRIRPLVSQTVALLADAVAAAGLQPAELAAVLLVGGTSRVPLVAQQVSATLGIPVVVDSHPKHAVALGAALHGVGEAPGAGATAVQAVIPESAEQQIVPELTIDVSELRRTLSAPVLVVVAGPATGRVIEIPEGQVTIGRVAADTGSVVLPDRLVSRRHLRIERQGEKITVEDAGSTNGTKLEGRLLQGRAPLLPGALVEIGATLMVLDHPGAEEPPSPSVLANTVALPPPPSMGIASRLLRRRRIEQWRAELAVAAGELRRLQPQMARARRLADPPAALAMRWAVSRPARLPRRLPGDPTCGRFSVGLGAQPGPVQLPPGRLGQEMAAVLGGSVAELTTDTDVPVTVQPSGGRPVGVVAPGPMAEGIVRSMVLQLLALHAPECFWVGIAGADPSAVTPTEGLPAGVPTPLFQEIGLPHLREALARPDGFLVVLADRLPAGHAEQLLPAVPLAAVPVVWVTSAADGPAASLETVVVYDPDRTTAEVRRRHGIPTPGVVLTTLPG